LLHFKETFHIVVIKRCKSLVDGIATFLDVQSILITEALDKIFTFASSILLVVLKDNILVAKICNEIAQIYVILLLLPKFQADFFSDQFQNKVKEEL